MSSQINSHSSDLTPTFLAEKTWDLYQTHGVPIEVSLDILAEHNLQIDQNRLEELINEHQKLSQTTSKGQFKSGLLANTDKTRKLHTATHILHQVLRDLFGQTVKQMGSAITDQKARFDFTLDLKLEDADLVSIEQKVQALIDLDLKMNKLEMTEKEAREFGAIGLFGEKYGQMVTVYVLQDSQGQIYSKEFCGGPHVTSTKEIGRFKILKQKSIGQGLKRLEFDVE